MVINFWIFSQIRYSCNSDLPFSCERFTIKAIFNCVDTSLFSIFSENVSIKVFLHFISQFYLLSSVTVSFLLLFETFNCQCVLDEKKIIFKMTKMRSKCKLMTKKENFLKSNTFSWNKIKRNVKKLPFLI